MATIVPAQQTAIANLYVALFNRAPDAAGFGFWVQALSNGSSLSSITTNFLLSPESKAIYPSSQTSEQFITSFYTTVFGRAPDAGGLAFWAGVVNANGGSSSDAAKAVAVAQIIAVVSTPLTTKPADITDAQFAQTVADRATFANKVEVGTYYAVDAKGTSVDTAKQVISGVNATAASVTAAKAIADSATNVGSTFTGTTGADSFTGTGANDTFNFLVDGVTAANSTLSAIDKVAGGAGTDTLNITTVGAVTNVLNSADVSGIETLAIRATTDGATSTLTAPVAGLTTVSVSGAGNVSLGTVTGLAAGTKLALAGVSGNAAVTAKFADTVTSATVTLSGGQTTAGALTVNGAGLTSATITGSNGANVLAGVALAATVKSVTIDAQSALTTGAITGVAADTAITVTGAGVANIGALAANVATVTATGNTGGLTATLSAATQKISGSAGVDTITTGAVLTTGSVDAGAGTADILIVADSTHLATAALGAKYTNFEILQVNNNVTVDLDNIAGITSVRIADGAAATGVTNLSVAQAAAVSITSTGAGAITLGVKGATTAGQIDTVKAALTTTTTAGAAQASDLTGLVLTGVEKLELTGNGTAAGTTGAVTLTTTAATSLDSIILKNAANGNSITVGNTHAAANLVVDASGSGATTIDVSGYGGTTGATLKGGAGFDVLFGSARSDIITGGAGNDVISGTAVGGFTAGTATALGTVTTSIAASTAADTLTGGEGRDVFAIGLVNSTLSISSITDLNLGTNAAAGGVDALYFDLATPATAVTIVTLTAAQQTAITGSGSLGAALDLAATAVNGAANAAATFTFGTDTYLIVNGVAAGNTFDFAQDAIVKITGVSGVLDASDIVII